MSDGRAIDHVVVAVDNLDAAAAAYESLGFTLTPRAAHMDRMGTSNRLAQFHGKNFIELLEVDRPGTLDEHRLESTPAFFSFGAHNKAFLKHDHGLSMLVFVSDDAKADVDAFRRVGIQTYTPFDFERQAILPDGNKVTVAFSLGFATSPRLPGLAFFVCQQHFPEYFWKPAFQEHKNGAQTIASVYVVAEEPALHADFLGGLFGGSICDVSGGIRVSCGEHQELLVLTPLKLQSMSNAPMLPGATPRFVGIAIESNTIAPHTTPSEEAYGMFIEWRASRPPLSSRAQREIL